MPRTKQPRPTGPYVGPQLAALFDKSVEDVFDDNFIETWTKNLLTHVGAGGVLVPYDVKRKEVHGALQNVLGGLILASGPETQRALLDASFHFNRVVKGSPAGSEFGRQVGLVELVAAIQEAEEQIVGIGGVPFGADAGESPFDLLHEAISLNNVYIAPDPSQSTEDRREHEMQMRAMRTPLSTDDLSEMLKELRERITCLEHYADRLPNERPTKQENRVAKHVVEALCAFLPDLPAGTSNSSGTRPKLGDKKRRPSGTGDAFGVGVDFVLAVLEALPLEVNAPQPQSIKAYILSAKTPRSSSG